MWLHDGKFFLSIILNDRKAKLSDVEEVMSNKFRQILKDHGFLHVPAVLIASFTITDEASS